eukprot:TRINITY_DN27724_c0_g1_i1.p1 TRINITY_DN27724_c0_g1~~TRINITY_DN27724_c0_g1_i1.p1  ORF type:complete len:234 (-),score=59.72 TRINITY_DN27724_c0_g1_i1:71-772(-)
MCAWLFFFFFKQKTAYEMQRGLVGSEMCIRDRRRVHGVLKTDLRHSIIIDNAIYSFAYQLDNGIPIVPFYDDKEDRILLTIRDYLIYLKQFEDVRCINRITFSLSELSDLNVGRFLKYYEDPEEADSSLDDLDSLSDSPNLRDSPRKTFPNIEQDFDKHMGIGKKSRKIVDSELLKLRESLPLYLASQHGKTSQHSQMSVSYTHLTLPTILLVQISVVAVSLKKKLNTQITMA